jgi:diguanylate cyclase (GGDEF)-like protein
MSALRNRLGLAGNPLDWPPGSKAWLVFVLTLGVQGASLLWTVLALNDPEGRQHLHIEATRASIDAMSLLCSINGLLVVAWLRIRHCHPNAIWHEYICTVYYAVGLCALSYFQGNLTMAVGVVLTGAPMLGFILFRSTPVLFALAIGLILQVTLSVGAIKQWWPYAPQVRIPLGADNQLSTFWSSAMYSISAPYFFIITLLSWYTLRGWRQREDKIRYLSVTDPLTGLPNRRSIITILENERENCRLNRQPLSVVMIDLDHFKKTNDQYGHAAGDEVLRQAARRMKASLRSSDSLGRFGGEEFLLLLPGVGEQESVALAERCRQSLCEKEVALPEGQSLAISGSFGLFHATRPDSDSVETMLSNADSALYEAKEGGRNRVVAHQS